MDLFINHSPHTIVQRGLCENDYRIWLSFVYNTYGLFIMTFPCVLKSMEIDVTTSVGNNVFNVMYFDEINKLGLHSH